jgi:hypothetical protein
MRTISSGSKWDLIQRTTQFKRAALDRWQVIRVKKSSHRFQFVQVIVCEPGPAVLTEIVPSDDADVRSVALVSVWHYYKENRMWGSAQRAIYEDLPHE